MIYNGNEYRIQKTSAVPTYSLVNFLEILVECYFRFLQLFTNIQTVKRMNFYFFYIPKMLEMLIEQAFVNISMRKSEQTFDSTKRNINRNIRETQSSENISNTATF